MKTAAKNSTEQPRQNTAQEGVERQLTEKECSKCKLVKTSDKFDKSSRVKCGLRSECKVCRKKLRKSKYNAIPPLGFEICKKCHSTKLKVLFRSEVRNKSGVSGTCMECEKARRVEIKERNKANRQKVVEFKRCCSCKERLPSALFNSNKTKADWLASQCRACDSKYKKEYYKSDHVKEREAVRLKEFAVRNKDHLKEYRREYYSRPDVKRKKNINAINSQKRQKDRIPSWEDVSLIKEFYEMARDAGLEVDHIIPLNSNVVCGLHCVDNFQMLTRKENASKGNRFWPDMP